MKKLFIMLFLLNSFSTFAVEICQVINKKQRQESSPYYYRSIYNGIRNSHLLECSDEKILEEMAFKKILRKWYYLGENKIISYGIDKHLEMSKYLLEAGYTIENNGWLYINY